MSLVLLIFHVVEVGSWAPEPGTLAGLWCLLSPNWRQHQSTGVFSESPFPQPESYPQVCVKWGGEWVGADKLLYEVVLIPWLTWAHVVNHVGDLFSACCCVVSWLSSWRTMNRQKFSLRMLLAWNQPML